MQLKTIDTKPGLVYSNRDMNGNPMAWDADCPCSSLYKKVATPGEVVRYEILTGDLGYCAKYIALSDGEVLDSTTGSVPEGFPADGGSLDLGFTGDGSSVASNLKWEEGSISSGTIPDFSGDLSHEYPSGWMVVEPGSSGHLPENLVYYYKSGSPMERGNPFSRTTQRFPMKERAPITLTIQRVTTTLLKTAFRL